MCWALTIEMVNLTLLLLKAPLIRMLFWLVLISFLNHSRGQRFLLLKTPRLIENTSTHTNREFNENVECWKQRGLTIQPIAPYFPELNIIEIVWQKIKYEWRNYLLMILMKISKINY